MEEFLHIRRRIMAQRKRILLKPYEADMRYILDTYIRAEDSNVISEMGNMSLVELLLQGKTTTPIDLVKGLPGNDTAKAE